MVWLNPRPVEPEPMVEDWEKDVDWFGDGVSGIIEEQYDPGVEIGGTSHECDGISERGKGREQCDVDWDSIRILETIDEEGRIEAIGEDELYELLGLRKEDEDKEKSSGQPFSCPAAEFEGEDLLVDDTIPEEVHIHYDKDHPVMQLGTLYPSMNDFRLAVRQFAINEEFEVGIEKSDPVRFRGYCKAKGCGWRIVGHRQSDLKTIMVLT